MIIAILSILIITLAVWLTKKRLMLGICPICAGVFLTWLWMLGGIILGQLPITDYQLPTALLMGGTVVGLISKFEQFIKPKFVLIWKTTFVVSGFWAMYNLLISNWFGFAVDAILVVVITFVFKINTVIVEKQESDRTVKELEEKMRNCC